MPHDHHPDVRHDAPRVRHVNQVLGSRMAFPFNDVLHRLEHEGSLEYLRIPTADLSRRRLRVVGTKGTEYLIALPRESVLYDGAVVVIEDTLGAVVRVDEQLWLRLAPATTADALELGYHAGNLHWRVRFDGAQLLVALEGPASAVTARLKPLLDAGRVEVLGEEA
ncbi:hypothetical protein [Zavarzinia sp.]|uniref:hypothetical protein n=1 Tax=Zavarzinia sp. TaxID=2027920 RepID=UPI00356B5994